MIDFLDSKNLKRIFAEIESSENRTRRYRAYKELDIYNQNQAKYVAEKINKMYGKDACHHIQTISEINLATRIVNAEASIYKKEPTRAFTNLNERQLQTVEQLYKDMMATEKLKLSNKMFRLGSQDAIQVIPDIETQSLKCKVFYKHQYDVVPDPKNPEKALAYVIPIIVPGGSSSTERNNSFNRSDNLNQLIADPNDEDLSAYKYIVWTDEYMFMANGNGIVLDQETMNPLGQVDLEQIRNPIGKIPFIDVCSEKLFGFWADHGSSLTDFTITFACVLSDMGEIVKLQGYSQPVISSIEEPKTISVGPHRVLWLKKDKNVEGSQNPTFEFATPSPDIDGSLNFIENVLRMFLTSRGSDSSLVTSKDVKDYSSGFERLIAMIERSEATIEDKVLFKRVEEKLYELIKLWINYLTQNTTDMLKPEYRVLLPDDSKVSVSFYEPEQIQTKSEKEDSVIKRMENGLMSRLEAIMELYGVDKIKAEEKLKEIDSEIVPRGTIEEVSEENG